MASWSESYRRAFRQHAFQLVAWGHQDARVSLHAALEEEEVTELLVRAMKKRLAAFDIPETFEHLDVHEDPPHSSEGRTGKRRRRIDIVIVRTQRGPNPELSFEAKRLGSSSGSLTSYMGKDGLGLFLSGAYAADQQLVGMLGYVQKGLPAEWETKVREYIIANKAKLAALNSPQPVTLCHDLTDTCRSRHDRPHAPVDVVHVLLDCT